MLSGVHPFAIFSAQSSHFGELESFSGLRRFFLFTTLCGRLFCAPSLVIFMWTMPVNHRGHNVYFPIFLVGKRSGGWRSVFNLLRINTFFQGKRNRIESSQTIAQLIQAGDYLLLIDFLKKYLPVPIIVSVCLLGLVEGVALNRAQQILLSILLFNSCKASILHWKQPLAPTFSLLERSN